MDRAGSLGAPCGRYQRPYAIPDRLDLLRGPASGTVHLPPHLDWSGNAIYDLDAPGRVVDLYRAVDRGGQPARTCTPTWTRGVLLRLWVLLWQRNRRAHGLGPQEREPAEQVLVPLDESALEQIEAAIAGRTWDTVVIGGGIRKPEPLLDFFEAVVNLVHVGAPTARIAFNSDGGSSLEAVQRVDA